MNFWHKPAYFNALRALGLAYAALGAGIGILTLIQGAFFQYVAFDFLWVVLLGYLFMRLINTDDPRWWIAIGIVIGMGMMTRYTMGVHVIALIIAVIAIAVIVAMVFLRGQLQNIFSNIGNNLT